MQDQDDGSRLAQSVWSGLPPEARAEILGIVERGKGEAPIIPPTGLAAIAAIWGLTVPVSVGTMLAAK